MAAVLYVVATPIGNLGDLSARALDTLRAVDHVYAEDTRRTRALLSHFGIAGKPLDSLHAHTDDAAVARIADAIAEGRSAAIVTDAGTPGVSDPGDALVRAVIARGVRVVPIPGASAPLAALSASGLGGGGGFRFFGFLPTQGQAREDALLAIATTPEPVVMFEAPGRVARTLGDLAHATPSRPACVARELTKLHEDFVRGTLAELAADPREWIGEIVLVLGAHVPDAGEAIDDDAVDRRIDEELAAGLHAKTVAARVAAWAGRPKKDVYARVIARKERG